MSDDLFNLIYNKSLDLLSRREHSRKELKEKLLLRFQSDDMIQTVLDKLETYNLINELSDVIETRPFTVNKLLSQNE